MAQIASLLAVFNCKVMVDQFIILIYYIYCLFRSWCLVYFM